MQTIQIHPKSKTFFAIAHSLSLDEISELLKCEIPPHKAIKISLSTGKEICCIDNFDDLWSEALKIHELYNSI